MKFIQLTDKQKTFINLEYVTVIMSEEVKSSSPYCKLTIEFANTKALVIKYEEDEKENMLYDIKQINEFVCSR